MKEAMDTDFPLIKERKRWLFLGLPLTFTTYRLDDKKLQLRKGFFTSTEDDILLYRILDGSLKRTLWQKMAGLGSLTVISSDKTNPNLELKNIKRIHAFKEALDERVEKERLRMRFRTGEVIENEFNEEDVAGDHN